MGGHKKSSIRFLALGDSYTIGEAVRPEDRWPALLVDFFARHLLEMDTPEIIAKTGWRTDELIDAVLSRELGSDWDLVSLCIGVNNQYQNKSIAHYVFEFEQLLNLAIKFCSSGSAGVFVFSIPDYAYTPFSKDADRKKISYELNAYNKIAFLFCARYGVSYFDVTQYTRLGLEYPEYVAEDGLHPSKEMYQRWIEGYGEAILNLVFSEG